MKECGDIKQRIGIIKKNQIKLKNTYRITTY